MPGFLHDVGSAVHPFAVASPFFTSLPLEVEWIHSPVPLAHPLDDGTAILLHRDLDRTAEGLGIDGASWRNLFGPVVRNWEIFRHELLGPLGWTKHPFLMARLGLDSVFPAATLIKSRFKGERAKALFAGLAAHYPAMQQPLSAGFGIALGAAGQASGWPVPKGGAQAIPDALVARILKRGGSVHTNSLIDKFTTENDLVLADTSPRTLARISGERLPAKFRAKLEAFRYGPGAFKVDWALSAPIPWRAKECLMAATVHLGGTAEEILASEAAAMAGRTSERPYILLAQPTLFDPTRAPAGKHTVWAYCHVPNGSPVDMVERMEMQIERFAPGFHDVILARHVSPPQALELGNANLVGGDATGGVSDWQQMLLRPTWRRYATPDPKIWLCSAATPPGAGVHGMCGYHAATRANRRAGL